MKKQSTIGAGRDTYREIINFADENGFDVHNFGETPTAKERTFLGLTHGEAPVAYYQRITFERSDQDLYMDLAIQQKLNIMLLAARTFHPDGYCRCLADQQERILHDPVLAGADFHNPDTPMRERNLYFLTHCWSCGKNIYVAISLDTPAMTPKMLGPEVLACAKAWFSNHCWAQMSWNSGVLDKLWETHREVDRILATPKASGITCELPKAPFVWF